MPKKRVAYFNPVISLVGQYDSGVHFYDEEGDTCRENVIGHMWHTIRDENDDDFEPEDYPGRKPAVLTATGRKPVEVSFDIGVPDEDDSGPMGGYDAYWGYNNYNSSSPDPDLSFIKKIRELEKSATARVQLSSLLDIMMAVPLMIYAGPKAYRGLAKPGYFKFNRSDYGSDYDVPTFQMYFKYKNISNCLIQHPALMSIVLGQARLALEDFSRSRYIAFNRLLNITSTRTRLRTMSAKAKFSPADKQFLVDTYKKIITLSDNVVVNRRLERYPMNKTFSHLTLKFLMAGSTEINLYKVWKESIGGNIYGQVGSYGFYKWLESVKGKTEHQKKIIDKVRRQNYSDIERRAYILNG